MAKIIPRNTLIGIWFLVFVLPIICFAEWTEPVRLSDHLAGDGPRAVVMGDTIQVVFYWLDLFHLRSTDNGRTWTEPVVISDTLGCSSSGDIAFNNGNIHVGWVVPPHGQIARPQLYHRSSSDGGITWSDPHHVFNHGGITAMLKYARLAAIGDTLFISCRTLHELLCFRSFDNGETWGDSTAMESGSLVIDCPQSLLASQRRLHVIYQLNIAGDSLGIEIYHRYSDDYGLNWSPKYMLSTQDDEHGQSPSAYADSSGHIGVAWYDYKYGSMCGVTGELLMRISTDNGESWFPESRVTYWQSANRSSILIVDQQIHTVWMDYRGGCSEGSRIFYSMSTDWGSRWQTPERITRGIESSEFSPFLVFSVWNGTIVLHCFIRKYWQPNVCDLFYLRSTEYTSISEWDTGLAENYITYGNYPNPFNNLTTIKFNTLKNTNVKVSIFDIRGKLIEVLFEGYIETGDHVLTRDAGGLASGIYFYRIEMGKISQSGKMVLLK